jgi:hypothetical protein
MKLQTSRVLKLAVLNLLFLNILAQEVSIASNLVSNDLIVTPITSAEIQAQSVLLAGNINRDWWIKVGIYTTAAAAIGGLIYNREAIKHLWQKDANLLVNPGLSVEECHKLREMIVQNDKSKLIISDKSFISQVESNTRSFASMAVAGAVVGAIFTPLVNKSVKFMRNRNLDYYLHNTQLLEQIEHLRFLILTMGDLTPSTLEIPGLLVKKIAVGMGLSRPPTLWEAAQELEQRELNLVSEIRKQLASIKAATITALAYMQYAQNDLATGIESSEAELIKAKLMVLRAISSRVHENCNNLLILVQQALGKLESEQARELLSNKIYQNYFVRLRFLFAEFNRQT